MGRTFNTQGTPTLEKPSIKSEKQKKKCVTLCVCISSIPTLLSIEKELLLVKYRTDLTLFALVKYVSLTKVKINEKKEK